jgi:hypothetical protein
MKKIIIIIVALLATAALSAQVTFSYGFSQDKVIVNAKTVIEVTYGGTAVNNATDVFAIGDVCQQEAIVVTVWQRAFEDNGTTAFATPTLTGGTAVSATADLPTGYTSPVCAANWTKWTFTIPAGTYTSPGLQTLTLNRAEGVCGTGSSTITFTIGYPQIPLIAVTEDAVCEDDVNGVELTATWRTWDGTTLGTPATAWTDDVTVNYEVKSLICTPSTWAAPSTMGLPNSIIISGGSQTVPVGDPGQTAIQIVSVTYTHTGCGTITINNSNHEN